MLKSASTYPFLFNFPISPNDSRYVHAKTGEPSTSQLAQPLMKKPRLRYSRSTTGCRSCRERRVKCPEGALQPNGQKLPCVRCVSGLEDGGKGCQYPAPGRTGHWVSSYAGRPAVEAESQNVGRSLAAIEVAVPPLPAESTSCWWQVGQRDQPGREPCGQKAGQSATPLPATISSLYELDTSVEGFEFLDQAVIGIADPPPGTPSFFSFFLSPAPDDPLGACTLSSIPTSAQDRSVISYFETKGCNDILSANGRLNWIWAMLFPRLFVFLTSSAAPPATSNGPARDADDAIRRYVYRSLLRLSMVHRANTLEDQIRAAELLQEASEQRQAATAGMLCARAYFEETDWHTDEYLAGFFVNCMADMLESRRLHIDPAILQRPAKESDSTFSISLRHMISVYAAFITACAPHSIAAGPPPAPESSTVHCVSDAADEWGERFFGFSRKIVTVLGSITTLVSNRVAFLRSSKSAVNARRIADAQAERLALDLGPLWGLDEGRGEFGHSRRVQRGTTVVRLAMRFIVLCELLECNLSDKRLQEARMTARELVADTSPQEIAGFAWALSIVAIYTPDASARQDLFAVLRNAQDWSFGRGFKGADEVIRMCWALYDREGSYRNGIAPWRETLAALDRSVYF